jgi:hypothetical protein
MKKMLLRSEPLHHKAGEDHAIAPHSAHSGKAASPLKAALEARGVDYIAEKLGEHPAEHLIESLIHSGAIRNFPTLSNAAHYAVPKVAMAAVILAYESMAHGKIEISTLAEVGVAVIGGPGVSMAMAYGKTAYHNQQARLERYREFAGTFLKAHPSSTSHEVSQAFLSESPIEEEHAEH